MHLLYTSTMKYLKILQILYVNAHDARRGYKFYVKKEIEKFFTTL